MNSSNSKFRLWQIAYQEFDFQNNEYKGILYEVELKELGDNSIMFDCMYGCYDNEKTYQLIEYCKSLEPVKKKMMSLGERLERKRKSQVYMEDWIDCQNERNVEMQEPDDRYINLKTMKLEPEKGPLLFVNEICGSLISAPAQKNNFSWVFGHLMGLYLKELDYHHPFLMTLPIRHKKIINWRLIHKMCLVHFGLDSNIKAFDAFCSIPAYFGHPIKYDYITIKKEYDKINESRSRNLSVVNIIYAVCEKNGWDTKWIPCKLTRYDKKRYYNLLEVEI